MYTNNQWFGITDVKKTEPNKSQTSVVATWLNSATTLGL